MTEEAMKVWRDARKAHSACLYDWDAGDQAAAAVIAAAMAADKARIVELEGQLEAVKNALIAAMEILSRCAYRP